ncbi:MAG: T9SS type A sorting domain-containing protein [Bacteroidales bacterium]|nr:T9SS type A sorting domain-containing protein [Bacteroidales bacterium]
MKIFYFSVSLAILMFCVSMELFAQKEIKIMKSSFENLSLKITKPNFSFTTIKTNSGNFNRIDVEGMVSSLNIGQPLLPTYNRLIRIPENAKIDVNILNSSYTDYDLSKLTGNDFPILPTQPSISKKHIGEIPFEYDKQAYSVDKFINNDGVSTKIIGNLRNMRLALLCINMFDYNPKAGILRVYDEINISISFPEADYALTEKMNRKYGDFCFSSVEKSILNDNAFKKSKDLITQNPIKMIIVSHPMFKSTLQPFIEWKTKKGFIIDTAYTSNPAVGNTNTSIKNYIKSQYENATLENPAPTYILLVGDTAQVPTFKGITDNHVTDFYYAEFTNDVFADAYFGRFSANNISQLQPQIDKTLEYEQYLFPSEEWLDTVIIISGVDKNYAPTHGNGQANYAVNNYLNSSNNIFAHLHLYPESKNESEIIKNEIYKGASYINYTAHGFETGWHNPPFSISNIPSMNNEHKYPLMVGNACFTNKFDVDACFGEALLRADKKGAIGYVGASNYSYWDEDYYWAVGVRANITANPTYDANHLGAYDKTWHTHGEPQSEWFISQGQLILAGNTAVIESGSSLQEYYSEVYNLMGDPSLMVYMGKPKVQSVNYPGLLPLGQPYINITAEPYTYIGISKDGVWHGGGTTDSEGNLFLNIIPITSAGNADIVATKQFYKPFFGTVSVQTPTEAFVSLENYSISDIEGNNNNEIEVTENIYLNINLKNYGLQNAAGINATLSTENPYIEIINGSMSWGAINAGESKLIEKAFKIKINPPIKDQSIAKMKINIKDENNTEWNSEFNIKVSAPIINILGYKVNDIANGNSNNRLDVGETADLEIEVLNSGHADIANATSTLTNLSEYITVNNINYYLDTLKINSVKKAIFNVTVSENVEIGTYTEMDFIVDAMGYVNSKKIGIKIGPIYEDWESGNFDKFTWSDEGTTPWIIHSESKYEGNFSAKSGDISDGEKSILSLKMNVLQDDSLTFYKKVSCEENYGSYYYDFLSFSLNETTLSKWAGNIDWSKSSFYITSGVKTVQWIYQKDVSESLYEDAAWIDNIVFPPMVVINSSQELPAIENDLLIYPNPATNDFVTLSAPITSNNISITITNINGQIVYKNNFETNSGQMYIPIKVSDWKSGIYTVMIIGNNENFSKSFIISK